MMSPSGSSTSPADWLPTRELQALHAQLTAVDDAKIPRLLSVVDAMDERGPVDGLIAPFRIRMSQLGTTRPLRFARLLFIPLNPVIVPQADWQARSPLIPRMVVASLADVVRDSIGSEARHVEAMISGRTTGDHQVVGEAGAILWHAASLALIGAAPPADWTQRTGLPNGLFPSMARSIGTVLGHVQMLQTWQAEAAIGLSMRTSAARNVLQAVNAREPEAIGLLLALTLAILPQAAGALRRAMAEIGGRTAEAMLIAMQAAAEALLARLETDDGIERAILGTPLRRTGAEVGRIIRLLGCVDRDNEKPARRARLAAVRRRLDESAQLRFALGLQKDFLQVLEDPAFGAIQASLDLLEEAARGLRYLATEATRVGNEKLYEQLVRQTTDAIKAIAPGPTFTLADKVRLVEILAGPDEAWDLLTEQATAP